MGFFLNIIWTGMNINFLIHDKKGLSWKKKSWKFFFFFFFTGFGGT